MNSLVKTKASLKKFSGPLKEPIVRTTPLALVFSAYGKNDVEASAIYQAESNRLAKEQTKKLEMLFDHYGIVSKGSGRWTLLAYLLAVDFVPGMTILNAPPQKVGRPPKWIEGSPDGLMLVKMVEAIQQERKKGIRDAVRIAKKRFPQRWPEHDADTLIVRYYEARKLKAAPFIEPNSADT